MRSGRKSKQKILIGILIAALLIAAFGMAVHLLEKKGILDEQFGDSGIWGSDDEIEISLGDTEYHSRDDVDTYLFVGTDAGSSDEGKAYSGQLADFLTLLIVDNTTAKYAFVPIDRNSMVDVQVLDEEGEFSDYYTQQICLSRWYGTSEEDRNLNTLTAVSEMFGYLDIDNYYVINMKDMGAVNDAIGGVTVTIEDDMMSVDPAFVKGTSVKLKGDQAEKFLRTRLGVGNDTNKERMSRQEQYMKNAYTAVMDKLGDDPEYVNDVYAEVEDKVESGEGQAKLSKLTNQLIQFENLGIMHIDGVTKLGDTQGDGVMHEEFYADSDSIASVLCSIIDMKESK